MYPELWVGQLGGGMSYSFKAQFPQAIEEFSKARALNPESTITLSYMATAYVRTVDRVRAMDLLAEIVSMSKRQYVSPFDVASMSAMAILQ